jgi:hypothetical protein
MTALLWLASRLPRLVRLYIRPGYYICSRRLGPRGADRHVGHRRLLHAGELGPIRAAARSLGAEGGPPVPDVAGAADAGSLTAPSSRTARPTPTPSAPPPSSTTTSARPPPSPMQKRPPLPPRPSPTWPPQSSSPPPPCRENESLAKYSHKTPTRDELVIARVLGLANPGSFR